jgi:hypothetical protein
VKKEYTELEYEEIWAVPDERPLNIDNTLGLS